MIFDLLSFIIGLSIASACAFLIFRIKREAWQTLSQDSLARNNELFLQLAGTRFSELHSAGKADLEAREKAIETIVDPVRQSLEKMDQAIQAIEKNRIGAYHELKQQVANLMETQHALRSETGNLVRALRTPDQRGRWGEIQLRRVIELAGMLEYCDFQEQATIEQDGKTLRPDIVIRLPSDKLLVIDAKTPLDAWLDACNDQLDDGTRQEAITRHARHVRKHIQDLGTKKYHKTLPGSPEFVVMFLPDEGVFSGALKGDGTLLEYGVESGVIPATPTTLIALLRSVHYGWRQEKLANEARDIAAMGREILERTAKFGDQFNSIGNYLGKAVQAYNQSVIQLDSKIIPSLQRLKAKGVTTIEQPETKIIDLIPAQSNAANLQADEPNLRIASS